MMNLSDFFETKSINARFIYSICCIDNLYYKEVEKSRFHNVIRCKSIEFLNTSNLDEWLFSFQEFCPYMILDESMKKSNYVEFEYLDPKTALELNTFHTNSSPEYNISINYLMWLGGAELYGEPEIRSPKTLKYLLKIINLLESCSVELPDINQFNFETYTQLNPYGSPIKDLPMKNKI